MRSSRARGETTEKRGRICESRGDQRDLSLYRNGGGIMISRVVYPKRQGRRLITALATLSILAGVIVFGSTALAMNNTGAFELDGNAVNAPAIAGDDWDNVCHEVTAGGFDSNGSATGALCTGAANTTGSNALSWIDSALDPVIFTGGGSKDPQDPQDSWLWKPKDTIPDKDTILHAFAARYSLNSTATCPGPGGNTDGTTKCDVIFFGSDRFANDG